MHTNPGQQGGLPPGLHPDPRIKQERVVVTVNVPELVTVPPNVVMAILPVTAPVGTPAVTCVSEFTVTLVAFTPPKVTLVV